MMEANPQILANGQRCMCSTNCNRYASKQAKEDPPIEFFHSIDPFPALPRHGEQCPKSRDLSQAGHHGMSTETDNAVVGTRVPEWLAVDGEGKQQASYTARARAYSLCWQG